MPAVSVIIVAYQSADCLPRCLNALAHQSFRDFEIILIDNASPDGGPDESALPDNARLIRNAENRGFAAANNQGAAEAKGRWIALLNPDAFARPSWLAELVGAAERHPDYRMIGSLQLMDEDDDVLDGAGDVYHASGLAWRGGHGDPAGIAPIRDAEIFGPCAAAALYDREMFLAAGGFDERYFCYFEDVDLALRLNLKGERALIAPRAVVRHVGSASSGGRRSDFAVYHGFRNRLWTFIKCTPALVLPLAVPWHLAATLALLAIHTARGGGKPAFRGLWDGLRGAGEFWHARKSALPAEDAFRAYGRAVSFSLTAPLFRGIHEKPLD
ncbi:MAG: glycosyltransferase family 2 protein [Euryhalocaulis sp.]|uniref:glycosyltransferase family 2 protein n=1 Tax=Euryhalocaulis sp. TaxID=2744307 RepID=UPI0017D89529|nr:glycosyltransferase family 2 protein [Euryhalocaulis sp.]MBA4801809.1 glycosyltransferase family 2 protein [Euryhalocaulis sp.]